jgi:hypothetical protein
MAADLAAMSLPEPIAQHVMREDELDRVRAAIPQSPAIAIMEPRLAALAEEIARRESEP